MLDPRGRDIKYFDKKTVNFVFKKYGQAKIITATNVFAHIEDVNSLMKNLMKILKNDGVFISESHYLVSLIKTNQYDYYPDEQGNKRWGKEERLLIITGISWENVHHTTNRNRVLHVRDVGLPSRSCAALHLPRAVEWTAEQEADAHERGGMRYTKEDYEVLAMSGSLATIPEGWEDGECLELSEPY